MKKATKLFTFLALFVLLTNCEKEELIETKEQPTNQVNPENGSKPKENSLEAITINEIPNLKLFLDKNPISVRRTKKSGNLIKNETSFGKVDFSKILKVTDTLGQVTYTFRMRSPYQENVGFYFNNLVVQVNNESEYNAYILRYTPNYDWKAINDYSFKHFTGDIKYFPLEETSFGLTFINKITKAERCMMVIERDCGLSGHHNDLDDPGCNSDTLYITVGYVCSGGGNYSGGGTYNNGNNDYNNPPGGNSNGRSTSPIFSMYEPEDDAKLNTVSSVLKLSLGKSQWLYKNYYTGMKLYDFLGKEKFSKESKNFAKVAIQTLIEKGEVDFDERLIYNPNQDNWYKSRMTPKEREIFDGLADLQKHLYLKSAIQAYNYAELHYPRPVRNRKGDAVKHSFWNALSTVRLGESLTKKLTNAHEDIEYDANYPNHHKETQMDFFNNAVGRQLAYGSGRLYQMVEKALANGDLRYLSNLEFVGGFWRATNASTLIPTNKQ